MDQDGLIRELIDHLDNLPAVTDAYREHSTIVVHVGRQVYEVTVEPSH